MYINICIRYTYSHSQIYACAYTRTNTSTKTPSEYAENNLI